MVFGTVYDDDDLDDADCDSGLAEGEFLDVARCGLLVVSVLGPVLVVDGLMADGLIFSCTVEAFGALVFGLAEASFGAKLNGVGVGAVPTEGGGRGIALNNVSLSMLIPNIFLCHF